MAGPRALQAETQAVQVVQTALGRDLAAETGRHPGRHLAAIPQAAVRRRLFQNLFQRRHALRVQQRSGPAVAATPIAQAVQPFSIPPLHKLGDPSIAQTRHPRHRRRRLARQKQPDHLEMRTTYPLPLSPIGLQHR